MMPYSPARGTREQPSIAPTTPTNTAQSDPTEPLRTADLPPRHTENGAGQVGSCAAWGTTYTAMGLLENRDRGSSQFENPSNVWGVGGMAPMYAYSQTVVGNDGGS